MVRQRVMQRHRTTHSGAKVTMSYGNGVLEQRESFSELAYGRSPTLANRGRRDLH